MLTRGKLTPVLELDTPAPVIDVEQMEKNLKDMADFARKASVRLRPHSKTHKSPILALKQMEYGAVGVCTQKVSEAEVMVKNGVRDVLVSNEIIGLTKLRRVAALRRLANLTICVDSGEGLRQLEQACAEQGVEMNVLVDIDVGMHRCGVNPRDAGELASQVVKARNLVFKGVMGYEGHIGGYPRDQWPNLVKESMSIAMDAKKAIEKKEIEVENFVVGGTPTAKISALYPGVTEITPGEYIFYDYGHVDSGLVKMDSCAYSVFCTVMSKPTSDRAVVDGGFKTFDFDQGEYPGFKDPQFQNVKFTGFSEEHGTLKLSQDAADKIRIGMKLEIVPYHVCTCINLQNGLYLAKKGEVYDVLPVLGRGMLS